MYSPNPQFSSIFRSVLNSISWLLVLLFLIVFGLTFAKIVVEGIILQQLPFGLAPTVSTVRASLFLLFMTVLVGGTLYSAMRLLPRLASDEVFPIIANIRTRVIPILERITPAVFLLVSLSATYFLVGLISKSIQTLLM